MMTSVEMVAFGEIMCYGGITVELHLLLFSFVLGIVLMIGYDGIRFFRIIIRHGKIAVFVEDLFFWMIASLAIFALLFLENGGKIRLYAMAAVWLGMFLWYVLIGRKWQPKVKAKVNKIRIFFKKRVKKVDKSDTGS